MTKAEKKVADVVLKDPDAAVNYTITDLSEKSGVGETSVMRFCRKLGFSGYHDFKLSIALTVFNATNHIEGDIGDDSQSVIHKITNFNSQLIQDTQELLNPETLDEVAHILLSGKKIHFYGVGSSGITAMDAYYRFMRIGLSVNMLNDSHIIAMSAALLSENDIAFGISTSGSTKDLVDPLKNAKENGATVICLTSHARSPITKVADTIILVPSKESPYHGGALSTKIAQLHALDILSNMTMALAKEKSEEAIKKTATAVADKLY